MLTVSVSKKIHKEYYMKKVAMIAAALLFGASAVFAVEGEVSFENKLSSDIVEIAGGDASFAGFTEKVKVNFDSENLDFGLTGKVADVLKQSDNLSATGFHFTYDFPNYKIDTGSFSWYVEFRPWQWLTLGWSDDVWTYGSYLPVWDDNVVTGNIGAANGFALIFRPIGGLRIGTAVDFGYTVVEYDDSADPDTTFKLNWNFGADYTYGELFSFGVSARDILGKTGDSWDGSIGVYASLLDLAGASVNLGYTYNDGDGAADVAGDNLITLGASYGVGPFGIDFDLAFAADNDVDSYDLYIGAVPAFDINDNWGASLEFTFKTNLSSGDNAVASDIFIHPEVTYGFNNHKFGLGVGFDICGSDTTITIPVFWKYNFKK